MNATSSRQIEILRATRWQAVKTYRAIIHVPVLMDIKVIFFDYVFFVYFTSWCTDTYFCIKEMDSIVLMSMNVISVTLAQILFLAVSIPKVFFNANVLMDMLKEKSYENFINGIDYNLSRLVHQ